MSNNNVTAPDVAARLDAIRRRLASADSIVYRYRVSGVEGFAVINNAKADIDTLFAIIDALIQPVYEAVIDEHGNTTAFRRIDATSATATPGRAIGTGADLSILINPRPDPAVIAPPSAGAAEPGNAHTWTARRVDKPATTWRELHKEPVHLWETDQFIARVEAEPESIAWNWHVEVGDQDAGGVALSADEAKRAAEQWIALHATLPGESTVTR